MKRILRSNRHIQHGRHHPLLAIDCENNPADGAFICAGVYGQVKRRTSVWKKGKSPVVKIVHDNVQEYFTDLEEFHEYLNVLKRNSCMLVFFNLSYDKIYINKITDHASILAVGSRVITLKLKENGIKAIDLTNHVDGSLADWIGYLDMTEKYGIAKAELTDYYDRVMNDAKATWRLGVFLEDFYYYQCGIPLMVTVGSNAMRLFTQKYFTDFWERDNDFISQYERNAYYGGRVELFKKGMRHTYNYDVNSMYLSIMHDQLIPDVSSTHFIENGKNYKRYINKYLGIFRCTVRSPDDLSIGILPSRQDGKLKFPLGEFTGTWTGIELKKALEYGYKILTCYDFIYYSQSKPYFRDFAAFVWRKRKEYKKLKNKGMDIMIKKIGNTLYGKFGQRNGRTYFGRVQDYKKEILPGATFYEVGEEVWVLIAGERVPAQFEFPVICAFITSYARIKLLDACIANQESLVYIDTDCLKLLQLAIDINIGSGLGQWEFEGETDVEFYRPKWYGDKCKGVPKTAVVVKVTPLSKTFKFEKPLRERESVRRGLTPNMWREVLKVCTFKDDKRVWAGNESTPIKYFESEDEKQGQIA